MVRNRLQVRGAALLMLTALIWGTAFVAQSVGMDYLGPCAFTATRNFIGCVALLPVISFASRLRGCSQPERGQEAAPQGRKAAQARETEQSRGKKGRLPPAAASLFRPSAAAAPAPALPPAPE